MKEEQDIKKVALRVSAVSIAWNVILSLFKLLAGIIGHSGAMISDAVHSASDVFSTIVVILGVNIASKQSDENHQYGHDRMECVAAILLSVVLCVTGIGIGFNGLNVILQGTAGDKEDPGMIALIAAVASIGVKEWMFWYTRAAAKKTNSGALMQMHGITVLMHFHLLGRLSVFLEQEWVFRCLTLWQVWLSAFLL